MSWTVHSPIDILSVETEAKTDLGDAALTKSTTAGEGVKQWVYVFNDEAATAFAVGDIVVRDPSATTETLYGGLIAPITTPASAPAVLGVAQHAIAAGSYGWIQTFGKALVKNGTANITADTAITSGADRAGGAVDVVVEEAVIGFSLEAEATNDTTFDAFLTLTRPV